MSGKCLIFSFLFFILMSVVACSKGGTGDASCDSCYFNEPTESQVVLRFSISDENPLVDFAIYRGETFDGTPIYQGMADSSELEIWLPLGSHYTVVADYCSNARNISVVAVGHLYADLTRTLCDEPCYMVYGRRFDLRLRF